MNYYKGLSILKEKGNGIKSQIDSDWQWWGASAIRPASHFKE